MGIVCVRKRNDEFSEKEKELVTSSECASSEGVIPSRQTKQQNGTSLPANNMFSQLSLVILLLLLFCSTQALEKRGRQDVRELAYHGEKRMENKLIIIICLFSLRKRGRRWIEITTREKHWESLSGKLSDLREHWRYLSMDSWSNAVPLELLLDIWELVRVTSNHRDYSLTLRNDPDTTAYFQRWRREISLDPRVIECREYVDRRRQQLSDEPRNQWSGNASPPSLFYFSCDEFIHQPEQLIIQMTGD